MTSSYFERGFSLIELSIVLIVFGLLAGSLLANSNEQRQHNRERQAQQLLQLSLEALYGFAISEGRLPCPAIPTLASTDPKAGEENCDNAGTHGVLPWRTLALPETDPWGQRLTYYVDTDFSTERPEQTSSFTLNTPGKAEIRASKVLNYTIANALPAVLISHGRNGLGGYRPDGQRSPALSPDEIENSNADKIFIHRPPDAQFDDLCAWIVPAVLKTRMLAAGRLP